MPGEDATAQNDGPAPVPDGFDPMEPAADFGSDMLDEFARRAGGPPAATDDQLEAQIAAALGEQQPASTEAADGGPEPQAQQAAETPPAAEPASTATEAPAGTEPAGAMPADDDGGPPEGELLTEPPTGYVWAWQDDNQQAQETRFTDEHVQQALRLASDPRVNQGLTLIGWAEQLTSEQREAMGRVAEGAVAVPRADYDRYQAWLHQQETAQRYPNLDDLDPEAAKIIRDQQARLAQLEGGQRQEPVAEPPAAAGYSDQQADVLARGYNAAIGGLKQAWQLSDAELEQVYASAEPFIGGWQAQHSEFNPITGQLMRPADPNRVMYDAFSDALRRNPALHEAVISRTHPSRDDTNTNHQPNPAAQPPATADKVAAKRARAASLASAPSAAVTPSPRSVKSLSNQELNEAMAKELAQAMNGDGG